MPVLKNTLFILEEHRMLLFFYSKLFQICIKKALLFNAGTINQSVSIVDYSCLRHSMRYKGEADRLASILFIKN